MLALAVVMLVLSLQVKSPAIEILDFTFYDTAKHVYRSTHVMEDLTMHRETIADPLVLLIETPSLHHRRYLRQRNLLHEFTNQAREVLTIVSCPTGMDENRYHTDMDTARCLNSTRRTFRVLLLDSEGMILKTWEKSVSMGEFSSTLKACRPPGADSDRMATAGAQ